MKTFYEQIPLDASKTYIIREFLVDDLTFPFHHHPFFEINYIVKGSGKRIFGQKITEFSGNDLTLIAPNIPHQFKDQETRSSGKIHSIITQFHSSAFENEITTKSEFVDLNLLFQKAKRGLAFGKKTIEKTDSKFRKLLNIKGFSGLLLFLEVLNDLAVTDDYEYLSEVNWEQNISGKGKELTDRVFHFIFNHFTTEISLEEVAQIAGLSKSAFSHFFKKRTGKTYSEFMNELRVSHSVKLLTNTEKNVIEICYASGFSNLSYFNRVFKNIHAQTPREYRKMYGKFQS